MPGTQEAERPDALPESKRGSVKRALNDAFKTQDHELAKRMLMNLARSLDEQHPGAAASLREGIEDLLTVKRLGWADRPWNARCRARTSLRT